LFPHSTRTLVIGGVCINTFARMLIVGFMFTVSIPVSIAQSNRLTVIISDTHFGVGKQANGQWHPYEDARWASEFALFLEAMSRQGNGKTDLVLNGDTFELWQSLRDDCIYPDKNISCTETDALNRLKVVLAAHTKELESLRRFATSGSNAISIIPGNHDVALSFPRVGTEVLKAIGAPADRVRILTDGYWISADGKVFAEHGQQIGEDVNRFSSWPIPLVERGGAFYLQRSWGEQFVQSFYNQFEFKYPIIDNLEGEYAGVTYGFKAEGIPTFLSDIGKFVRFYLTQTSFTQLLQTLGEDKSGVKWDIDAIRKSGDIFFAESIPNDDPLRPATEKAIKDGILGVSLKDLSDNEIQAICDRRAGIAALDDAKKVKPRVSLCPKPSLGASAEKLLRSRDSIFMNYLLALSRRLINDRILRQPFEVYVFSHTHTAEASYSPFEGSGSSWVPVVMNSGAWQRTISDEQLQSYMQQRGLRAADVLKLNPEDLPPCYPVILISAYSDHPRGALRYWQQTGGTWSLTSRCTALGAVR
jgi:UDP-2,3-diacylglucosamine pyrophosphatase LpxH